MIQEKYIFISYKKIAGGPDSVFHVAPPAKNRSEIYPEIYFVGNSQSRGEGRKGDGSTPN